MYQIVVEENVFYAIRYRRVRDLGEAVETGVQHFYLYRIALHVIVAQVTDGVLVHVQPLDAGRQIRIIEIGDLIVGHVEPHQFGQSVEHTVYV